jgi:nucleoside-diphosphate-sugar epimerase
LHISDCIEALVIGIEKSKKKVEVFKVGSEDQIDVKTIAHTVVEEMKLENAKFRFTVGVASGGGWIVMSKTCFWT